MPELVLEGGTDVAELALFSIDELPPNSCDDETLSELVKKRLAIRMPTEGDGSYLLYLYVDEDIPEAVFQYCLVSDELRSEIHLASGRIGFGGVESTFAAFKPNHFIRSDGSIPKGSYRAMAYRTEYPDDLIEDAVDRAIGKAGAKVMSFPTTIVLSTLALTVVLLIIGFNVNATALLGAGAAVVAATIWFKSYTQSEKYLSVKEQKLAVERDYPSIVVRLVSKDI